MVGFDFVNAGLGSRHSFLVLPMLFGTPSTTTPSPPMMIFFIVPLLLAAVAKQSLTDSVTTNDNMPCHGGDACDDV